ncbi:Possible Transcriptional Regulator [Thiobacillus denitrificans ATCC 25259]|uniref:Possible Transcriptional Regulator n=1 Tax=Thiobacillus denitrificans (strain ATCC 25259 / T1) TaxID=292415 RepID=Q3SFI0_THIDA|nr:AlpA family phage regulatory protein [Thiobacillus denitrificans]AAZ98630.1 Possible Transcriptional Regulator [Thiobacillus denitrificans ATCC 25259]
MAAQLKTALTILRRRQVEKRVGLTRSPLYARIQAGTFPKPIRLGNGRAVGWIEAEIDAWLDEQIEKSRKA